jgi:hypothetical protein
MIGALRAAAHAERRNAFKQPPAVFVGLVGDDSTQHPVCVLNPKRIQVFVTRSAESSLPSKLVNQIIYKLTERCRLKKE